MIEIRTVAGPDVAPWLSEVSRLRIEVFREWPYLYDGDLDYEREYVKTYSRSQRSVFVLALDAGRVVGASTGVPLADEVAAFQAPFRTAGIPVEDVFYFGESVLDPAYRGQGIGHRFFDAREAHARALVGAAGAATEGAPVARLRYTAFCAVVRRDDDPRRPTGHRGNEAFWAKRGYVPRPEMRATLEWKEVGGNTPVTHELAFWMREWS